MNTSKIYSMHTTKSENKDEDINFQPATSSQLLPTVVETAESAFMPEVKQTNHQVYGARKGTKETVLYTEGTIPQRKKRCFSCPLQGIVNNIMTSGVIYFMTWCMLWLLSGPEVLPGGNLFGLVIIFYSACLGGTLLELIRIPAVPPLPPLLGMLLAGFIIRNIPSISKHVRVPSKWSSTLRSTALTIILIRAGLGLDPEALRQMKGICFRLSFGPCIIEACTAAVVSHFIMDFPWQWGFLLGFVLGAVSPAVVVPSMLRLQEAGYGIEKGIPTLLIAASSMDDVMAITGFNTFLNLIFSKGNILNNVLSTLWDVFVGVLVGTVFGLFVQYFPSEDQEKVPMKRAFLILSMSISAVLGSQHIGLHGAGGLFTLVLSFTAGLKWAKEKTRVQKLILNTWNIFEPLLFGLVGSEVSVSSLKTNAIGTCFTTLCLAVCVRILSTFAMMCFAGFNFKEKIFIAFSWMPKATVQAVLGPLALETARLTAPHLESYSKDVMTVAFLAILFTAPNGSLLIGILGPRMLSHHSQPRA